MFKKLGFLKLERAPTQTGPGLFQGSHKLSANLINPLSILACFISLSDVSVSYVDSTKENIGRVTTEKTLGKVQ